MGWEITWRNQYECTSYERQFYWTGRPILRIYLLSYELNPFPGCFSLALVVLVLRLFSFTGKQAKKFLRNVFIHCFVGPERWTYFFPILLAQKKIFWEGIERSPFACSCHYWQLSTLSGLFSFGENFYKSILSSCIGLYFVRVFLKVEFILCILAGFFISFLIKMICNYPAFLPWVLRTVKW